MRFAYSDDRPVGVFQNDVQRQLIEGYGILGRRLANRFGGLPFTLPGETVPPPATQTPRLQWPQFKPLAARKPPATGFASSLREAFTRYGGFERRNRTAKRVDPGAALRRRSELIEATGLNAPVYRAMLDSTGVIARSATAGQALPGIGPGADAATGGSRLDVHLQLTTEEAHVQAKVEGWRWFREGRYRRSARAFESARLLDPEDFESRTGEIFSYLALGATRTALAVFDELTRRETNPFVHQLDVAELGGNSAALLEIRLGLRARADVEGSSPNLRALYALVLWYLGDKDEARLTASDLARSSAGADYAGWPAIMDAARNPPDADRDPS